MRDPDDAGIRRYLLGGLPEADAVEEAYLSDPDVFARVRAVEDDLLDDYAAGLLSGDEKAAFETRYGASAPLRRRVATARALHGARARAGTEAPPAVLRRPRWLGPLAIAAGLVIAGLLTWIGRSTTPQPADSAPPKWVGRDPITSPAPTTPATSSASPPAGPTAAPPVTRRLVLALSPTLLRGAGGPTEVRLTSALDVVVLEMHGDPVAIPAGARLRVAVETVEGDPVWSGPARRGRPGSATVASAEIPVGRLGPADYLVTLSAGEDTLYRYFFRILRP